MRRWNNPPSKSNTKPISNRCKSKLTPIFFFFLFFANFVEEDHCRQPLESHALLLLLYSISVFSWNHYKPHVPSCPITDSTREARVRVPQGETVIQLFGESSYFFFDRIIHFFSLSGFVWGRKYGMPNWNHYGKVSIWFGSIIHILWSITPFFFQLFEPMLSANRGLLF